MVVFVLVDITTTSQDDGHHDVSSINNDLQDTTGVMSQSLTTLSAPEVSSQPVVGS